MVLWFTILFYVFLFFIVYKMSGWKHLIKIQHLYIYTEICHLCQVFLMLGALNSLTHSHWGLAEASPFPEAFATVPR